MKTTLPKFDVVLLGIGHTNAHVLRRWRMSPIPDAQLTCISDFSRITYSGMLPGVLSGQYPSERMEIDLVRSAASAGARLIVSEVTGLDIVQRQVLFADRPPARFDILSIGTGSVPDTRGLSADDGSYLEIKPMQTFVQRLTSQLQSLKSVSRTRPVRITIVGAGAGGIEVAFCLPTFVRRVLDDDYDHSHQSAITGSSCARSTPQVQLTIVDGNDRVIRGVSIKTSNRVSSELEARGTKLLMNRRVVAIRQGAIQLAGGESMDSDLTIWATRAIAPAVLSHLGLPTEADGFLSTNQYLQSIADEDIFVVGDSGTIKDISTPKAGVYAVRQGPVLWENIQRKLEKRPLVPFQPQHDFLKLFNTGDGSAIGEYKGFTIQGKWCWKLKDWIDGRFMDMYQNYDPQSSMMEQKVDSGSIPALRCAGCGGKVGGSVLSRVLDRLRIPTSDQVMLGLDQADDVAVIRPQSRPIAVTVDFFAAPFDDPYTLGRLAALNAASDVFASGGRPIAFLTMATIPAGRPRHQEQLLFDLMDGALREIRLMNATLVGGHTIEGPQLTIGFTVLGEQTTGSTRIKGGIRAGDVLVLTKPLGTGVLLAAHMQARCPAQSMDQLIPFMLERNQVVAEILGDFDVSGLTDVTGFGLAGHLLEMLRASQVAAEIELGKIALIAGARELFESGLESTIAPANRQAESEIKIDDALKVRAEYSALFDPQTCGGLLIGISAHQLQAFLERLNAVGIHHATAIGTACEKRNEGLPDNKWLVVRG